MCGIAGQKCLYVSDRVRFKGRDALECGLLQSCIPEAPPEWSALQSPMELVEPDLKGGRPEAPRCLGVALGACDLGSPSVAQTWEAGDHWPSEIPDSLPFGQWQVLWRDRESKV